MTALAIGAGAAVLGTGLNLYKGLHQEHQANQIEKGLKDPVYNIPSEFYQNREIARQMAQTGLPQQQYNNQVNNIDQNQAGAIAAENNSANPGAAIASTLRASNAAKANLDASDAEARNNNQRYFLQENKDLAGQELAKQQSDVFDKYTRNFNMMQAYRGAGQQNVNNVVNGLTQVGLSGLNYAANNGGSSTPSSPATQQTFGDVNGTQPLSATSVGMNGNLTPYTAPNTNFNPYGANGVNPAQPYGTGWTQFQPPAEQAFDPYIFMRR